jgi:hypothetical protein
MPWDPDHHTLALDILQETTTRQNRSTAHGSTNSASCLHFSIGLTEVSLPELRESASKVRDYMTTRPSRMSIQDKKQRTECLSQISNVLGSFLVNTQAYPWLIDLTEQLPGEHREVSLLLVTSELSRRVLKIKVVGREVWLEIVSEGYHIPRASRLIEQYKDEELYLVGAILVNGICTETEITDGQKKACIGWQELRASGLKAVSKAEENCRDAVSISFGEGNHPSWLQESERGKAERREPKTTHKERAFGFSPQINYVTPSIARSHTSAVQQSQYHL